MASVEIAATDSKTARARPFLKWVGGKGQLVPQLLPLFPQEFNNYFEPFMGSAAVFFALRDRIKSAYLSDSNEELVNTFRQVKEHSVLFLDALRRHRDNHSKNPKEYYYLVRSTLPGTLKPFERAARFIYLNKTCFNGLYRVNLKGHYNVPMGAYKNPGIFDPEALSAASRALAGIDIRTSRFDDFKQREPTANDFVYFDPPYIPLNRTSNFTSYTRDAFGEAQQKELHDLCRELDKRGCFVVQSNSDTPTVRKLYSDLRPRFRIFEVNARRAINSVASKRGAISEVVITNVPV
ncbi:MAG: DNA adenine methylase [Armatimonadota bacterium]